MYIGLSILLYQPVLIKTSNLQISNLQILYLLVCTIIFLFITVLFFMFSCANAPSLVFTYDSILYLYVALCACPGVHASVYSVCLFLPVYVDFTVCLCVLFVCDCV